MSSSSVVRWRCGALATFSFMLAAGASAESTDRERGSSFAQRLFDGAFAYANQSLHGRFIRQMAEGTLPHGAFQYYLMQDNLYLSKYARAFAVIGAKAERTDELQWMLNTSLGYLHEHGKEANRYLEEQAFEQQASPVTVAYTSFYLQAAWSEDPVLAYASVLPCQHLYDWLFSTLKATTHIADNNPYRRFIDQYASPRNHWMTQVLEGFLNRYAEQGVRDELVARAHFHYNTAMRYEVEFFDQAFSSCGSSSSGSESGPGCGGHAHGLASAADVAGLVGRRSLAHLDPEGAPAATPAREPESLDSPGLRPRPRVIMA